MKLFCIVALQKFGGGKAEAFEIHENRNKLFSFSLKKKNNNTNNRERQSIF